MKNLIVAFFIITLAACNQNDNTKSSAATKGLNSITKAVGTAEEATSVASIEWLDPTFQDLGKVQEGQVVEITWRFKNTSDKPLIIQNTSATCGCTVAEKPEEPVAPGKEGVIRAKFDSNNREGEQRKEVFVTANTSKPDQTLSFRVDVTKK
jgi:hypothetical protein